MITVFLTDEAQDALIEEFEENGFPQLCSDEWTKDILLEPIEAVVPRADVVHRAVAHLLAPEDPAVR